MGGARGLARSRRGGKARLTPADRSVRVWRPRARGLTRQAVRPSAAHLGGVPSPRRRAERWRDRLIAGDPAGSSGRIAVRALLCLVGAGGSLMVFGGSVQSALLASVLSMVTCVAVVEPRPGAQAATMALGFASALGTVCVATLVTGSTLASGAVLCALVFVIVLARAVGPRGMAIGMLGFMGYFFANFIRARPSQIPQIALAIAVGGAVAFVVRFLVIPEHPARTQRRVLRAFAARMRLSLDDLEAEIA